MKTIIVSISEYIDSLSEDKRKEIIKLRSVILNLIPEGFEEVIYCGMISYVVPLSIYPSGYHCDPSVPLALMNIAAQKNHLAFYHMGIYGDKTLREWFIEEFSKVSKLKLDIGKSCIRLKYNSDIPYDLFGELSSKLTPHAWIDMYEKNIKKKDLPNS